MPLSLYNQGVSRARRLIRSGNVNTASSWSFSAADGNRILGDPPDWTEYASWHLGFENDENRETKNAWRYPFGKFGNVYRSGLIAIRQRSAQQGQTDIFEAAGRLIDAIDNRSSAMKWYDIRAQGNTAEIWLYGDIALTDDGNPFANDITAKGFIDELNAFKGSDITLRINSRGGGVHQGMAIYQALLRHPAQVHAEIDVIAGSISSVIPMAADYVTIAETAQFMIHDPWIVAQGNSEELRKLAGDMDTIREGMVSAYMRRWKGTREELLAALSAETLYGAEDAVKMGFADDIYTGDLRVAAHFTDDVAAAEKEETARIIEGANLITQSGLSQEETAHIIKEIKQALEPAAQAPGYDIETATESVAQTSQPETTDMTIETNAAGGGGSNNVADITAKILAKDKERRNDIAQAFARFSTHIDLMRECQDDQACTVADAKGRLLEALGAESEPRGAAVRVESGEDKAEKFRKGAVQWLCARAGTVDHKELTGNEYRGMTLVDLARESLMIAGIETRGKDRMAIVKAAIMGVGGHGTSDYPNLLEDTMNKTLMTAYETAPDTWSQWCMVGSVSDFRAHSRLKLGTFSNLTQVYENGEFQYGTIGDAEKETVTAKTMGRLIAVSRQALVNDDLQAFDGVARMMGRAAARAVEADVYAELALNSNLGPTLSDTLAMFDAGHANIGTGAAMTAASIDEARQLMTAQTDPDGNDYLNIMPRILLVSEASRALAIKKIGAEYDPDILAAGPGLSGNVPNPVRDMVRVVSTPRLSGTRWYMFADPNDTPTFEVAFLDGNRTPFLDQEEGFNIDGVTYKVRLDYGVAGVDYRGAVTNAGA